MAGAPFQFRRPPHGLVDPRVVTVSSREAFETAYSTDGARVIETEYRFGGFHGLLDTISRAAFGRKLQHVQVLLEEVEAASREQPTIIYVRNGDAAAREFGADLIDFLCFWESYAFTSDAPSPMFLVLELRSQRH